MMTQDSTMPVTHRPSRRGRELRLGVGMNAYQAQRIRFGILAARHALARDRMTPGQVEYLEGCEIVGWRRGDAGTRKAYDREQINIQRRGGRGRYSFRAHRLSLRQTNA